MSSKFPVFSSTDKKDTGGRTAFSSFLCFLSKQKKPQVNKNGKFANITSAGGTCCNV